MLTEFQKQKLSNYFNMYDVDKNGFIEKTDFEQMVKNTAKTQGWSTDSSEYKKLYNVHVETRWKTMQKQIDADGDDRISPNEYFNYVEELLNNPELYEAEVIKVTKVSFDSFDTNGDGHIDLGEYQSIYKMLGLDENLALEIFKRLDLNQDGHLSKDEYVKLIDQFFKSQDPEAPGNWFFGYLKDKN